MSLGTNIRKRRFELHMSQQELADRLGYKSRSTIAKIESGENDISHAKLIRLAQALDISFEALTLGTTAANYDSDFYENRRDVFLQEDENTTRKNIAVILAGGKSIRNHQNIPNQFIEILGKPIIVYCMEAYQTHPLIDDIYVVCLKGWEAIVRAYAKQYHISKLKGLIENGPTGILSVKNAFDAIENKYDTKDTLIFQESTRPLVTVDMISRLLQSCALNDSATICQSMKDHVQLSVQDYRAEYINRDTLVDLQSPEAHKLSRVKDVFSKAVHENHQLHESCFTLLMYNLGFKINFIEGSTYNIKVVRQEDIAIASSLIKMKT